MCEHSSIIYILTDDMGHGDVSCLNENSEIPIPNIARLESKGMIVDRRTCILYINTVSLS